jgi:hypothetical protein
MIAEMTEFIESDTDTKPEAGRGERNKTSALYYSCHARQKFHQSLREVGISIGDLWPIRGALVEDTSQCCPPLEHFWPDIAAVPIDAIRNATAGALSIGQHPRANVPAASAVRE